MGLNLQDYRSLFDDLQKESKFYKSCKKKYGLFDEVFLKAQADQYSIQDWYIISYFSNISTEFIENFKEELEPALLRSNKYTSSEIKSSCLRFFESTPTIYQLQLNKNKKLKIKTYPAEWL